MPRIRWFIVFSALFIALGMAVRSGTDYANIFGFASRHRRIAKRVKLTQSHQIDNEPQSQFDNTRR